MRATPVTLEQLRKHIDLVDRRLLGLLSQRARLAVQVGRLKKRQGKRLFDPTRERAILRQLTHHNHGPLPPHAIQAIFREILRQARRLERSV